MKVEGYEIGAYVTDEEFATYMSVKHRFNAEYVANSLTYLYPRDFEGDDLTQEEFECLVAMYEHTELRMEMVDLDEHILAGVFDEFLEQRG